MCVGRHYLSVIFTLVMSEYYLHTSTSNLFRFTTTIIVVSYNQEFFVNWECHVMWCHQAGLYIEKVTDVFIVLCCACVANLYLISFFRISWC